MVASRISFKIACRRRGLSLEATDALCAQSRGDWSTAIARLAVTRDARIRQLNQTALR